LQAFGTAFECCDCVTSLLTRILPYIGFTFNTPDPFCTLLYYCTVIHCTSDRAANLKVLVFAIPCHHFTSALSIHISPITYIQAHHRTPSPTHANFVSRVSKIDRRVSRLHFFLNRHFATYNIHFRIARTSVLSYSCRACPRSIVAPLDCFIFC
jgi:hypothetical protein